MSDPRLTPFNGRIAHTSLKERVAADTFVDGDVKRVTHSVIDLTDQPHGNLLCQLLYGETFRVLEDDGNAAFGIRELDGYVGYVPSLFIQEEIVSVFDKAKFRIAVPHAAFLDEPDIKIKQGSYMSRTLPFGSLVWHRPFNHADRETKLREDGWFSTSRITSNIPNTMYLKWSTVVPADQVEGDPAAVAQLFLHTPYLWGGNSSFGIDCSGLVQIALTACGKTCPRDSDMQFDHFARIDRSEITRSDLVFWKGHVGMMLDEKTLIHANAYHMMVAIEPLDEAIDRIGRKEFGDVIGFARP